MIVGEKNGWGWAKNNKENDGRLQDDLHKVTENVDDFYQIFMTEDFTDIKAKYAAEHLVVKLESFMALETKVSDLEGTLKRLQKMHRQFKAA